MSVSVFWHKMAIFQTILCVENIEVRLGQICDSRFRFIFLVVLIVHARDIKKKMSKAGFTFLKRKTFPKISICPEIIIELRNGFPFDPMSKSW